MALIYRRSFQLAQLSDPYRGHWDNCSTNSNATACRAELPNPDQEQQKMLLEMLVAMNAQPKAEQKKLY